MSIEFSNLLVALVFLLPGFLTSRLIAARTPAIGRAVSTFQETFESLLRSICIHLVIAPFAFVFVKYVLLSGDHTLISRIDNEGVQAYYIARPFQVTLLLFGWLVFAFVVAFVFGYVRDPFEIMFNVLVKKTRTSSEDVFYQLTDHVAKLRIDGKSDAQLWIQARLKNGYIYQGEFAFVGYRHDGLSRELMLTNVTFFSHPTPNGEHAKGEAELYKFVVIDVANCDSLEVLIGKGVP